MTFTIQTLSSKLLHYICFKIENTYYHPEYQIDNIDEYEIIVNIYKYIISNSIDSLINKQIFIKDLPYYLSHMINTYNLSSTDIDYLYETIIANIDKVVILKEGSSESEVKGFNLNIQLGLSHQSYSNYNNSSLLLEIFNNDNEKHGDLYELSIGNAEKFVNELKELYKNI